jgi:hypothetical protein
MKSGSIDEVREGIGDHRLLGLRNVAPGIAESRDGIRAGIKREP